MFMTTLTVRPQPLGIYQVPVNGLILPDMAGVEVVRMQMVRGQFPQTVPDGLQFLVLAYNGDIGAAAYSLSHDHSPQARYNRFVLMATPKKYERLKPALSGDLALLLDTVAYTLGYIDRPPAPNGAQDELLAFILKAHATYHLEQYDDTLAIRRLEEAIAAARPVSPLLAARLIAKLAQIKNSRSLDPVVLHLYQEAINLLETSDLITTRGELWLNLGMTYQDIAAGQPGPLLEAVRCYQEALRVFSRDGHPEAYALAQNNLAAAYLSMPFQESDYLWTTVRSLREALKIYKWDSHPDMWTTSQRNLAEALQHLPSSPAQENLAQAIKIYEELLAGQDWRSEPLAYARLLADYGTALAQLGLHLKAGKILQKAVALFEEHGDERAAHTIAGHFTGIPNARSAPKRASS